jgi:hypothetical protein
MTRDEVLRRVGELLADLAEYHMELFFATHERDAEVEQSLRDGMQRRIGEQLKSIEHTLRRAERGAGPGDRIHTDLFLRGCAQGRLP